ncbi:hypothetical protein [Streptomyces prunicolor]
MLGVDPVRAVRVGGQDLFEVVDDQQEGFVNVVEFLGVRSGQQIDQ